MATIAPRVRPSTAGDERFFLTAAIVMALVLAAGFSLQLMMGRSSFASPLPVHLHAFIFFGWTAFFVLQTALATAGSVAMHRRLGWLAAIWVPTMVAMGIYVTVAMIRRGAVPFFFEPLYFLAMDVVMLLVFAGLTATAILMRRRTQWHRRLMYCGMALLTAPGFGRLLPMPLLIPWAGWAVFIAVMVFPLAGVIADLRRTGRVHPAWWWGIATLIVAQIAIGTIVNSAFGDAIYQAATEGSPGAMIDPRAYPLPPSVE